MNNKKILITGGTGFIGSWLAESWHRDYSVTLFDNGRRDAAKLLPPKILREIDQVPGDIRDEKTVKKLVRNKDIVIHLAAIAGASAYEKDPLGVFEVNLSGAQVLLQSLVSTNVDQVVLFSSSEVYGERAVDVKETDSTIIGSLYERRWSYAVSKLAVDHLAFAYFHRYQVPVVVVRPFNVYGPRQVGEGAIVNMIQQGIHNNVIPITGDGWQKRSWCYISDLVKAVQLICIKKLVGECYNIGNPKEYVSMKNVAKRIHEIIPSAAIVYKPRPKTEIINRKPNIVKAQQEFGFEPSVSLSDGLRRTYDWHKKITRDGIVL